MLALNKAWIWIKKHWYVPVLFILALVAGAFSFSRNKKLIEMLEINKESYEKQIKVLEDNHSSEIKRRDEIYAKYMETMKKLNKDHQIDLDNLDKQKKKKMDDMVKKYKGTPEELAKELAEMFGVDYVQ